MNDEYGTAYTGGITGSTEGTAAENEVKMPDENVYTQSETQSVTQEGTAEEKPADSVQGGSVLPYSSSNAVPPYTSRNSVPAYESRGGSIGGSDEHGIFVEKDFSPYGNDPVYGNKGYMPMQQVPPVYGYGAPGYGYPPYGTGGMPPCNGQVPPSYGARGVPPYGGQSTPPPYYGDRSVPPYNGQDIPPYGGQSTDVQGTQESGVNADTAGAVNAGNSGENAAQQDPQPAPPPIPPYGGYVPYQGNGSFNGGYRQFFPQVPPPPPSVPDLPAPTDEAAARKKPKILPMVIIFLVIVIALTAVMVMLAIADKDKKPEDFKPENLGSPATKVEVNIEVQHREPADKGDYADEASGLFTVNGAIKYVNPSVVSVYGYSGTTVINSDSASGVIISEDGYIITNAHVVEDIERVKVMLLDERTFEAKIVGSDPNTDLAVLKVEATGLTPAVLGSTDSLSQGDTVISIGNSNGLPNTVTIGCVSFVNREIESYTGYPITCVQTDAALKSGISGGALIDLYGRVVGITTSRYNGNGTESLGFAIATDFAVPIVEDIIELGYVSGRPRMGILYNFIDVNYAETYDLRPGLLVREISPDCDIANTDLRVDDIITELDGKPITTESAVREFQNSHKPGDKVKAKVFRKGTFEDDSNKYTEFEIEFTLNEFEQ